MASSTETGKPVETAAQPPGAAAFALALCFVLACTVIRVATGGAPGHEYERRWSVVVSDFGLVAVILTQLGALRTLLVDWRRHRCAAAAMALGVSLLLPLAVHPSTRGVLLVVRWFGVVALGFGIGRLRGAARTFALGGFAAATAFQVAVALAQRAADGPIGLQSLGEQGRYIIGGRFASSGLTFHPYILAAWCTVAAAVLLAAVARSERPPPALLAVAVLPLVAVGLTMSRTGALAAVLLLGSFAVAAFRQPRLRVVLAAAVAAAALGVVLNYSGWASRAGDSVGGANVTSGRTELLHQANGLFPLHPILGVGPGRYVDELVQHPELVELATEWPSRPVHLVPYLVLVEGGLVVLPALLFLAWAVITQSWRGGAVAVGLTLAVVPFLALDHTNWSFPQGLVLTGIWLGALDHLGSGGSA